MNIKEASVGKGTIYRLSPQTISEGENCRQDYGDIEELSKSIVEVGLKKPIEGCYKDNIFIISDGHRRFRAIKRAMENGHEFASIECINKPKINEETRLFDQLLCNSGKPFTPIEQAIVIQKLVNLGWKQKDIALKLGKSIPHVSNMLQLIGLPQRAQNLVHEGVISATNMLNEFRECKNDEKAFAEKVDEIENKFLETGKKVTKKKSGVLSKKEEIEPKTEENKQEGYFTDPDDENAPSNKIEGEPSSENGDVKPKKERVKMCDYKFILGKAMNMIIDLAKLADDKQQEQASTLVEKIEKYL